MLQPLKLNEKPLTMAAHTNIFLPMFIAQRKNVTICHKLLQSGQLSCELCQEKRILGPKNLAEP